MHTRKFEQKHGEVLIDQNARRYGSFPVEPMARTPYNLHPEFKMKDVDVIIDRDSMGKLLDFVTANPKIFQMDVEIIGRTAIFVGKDKQATKVSHVFPGFGLAFLEEYTNWPTEVKGSSCHHRIAELTFAGLKYLLKFESAGYLPEEVKVQKKEHATEETTNTSNSTITESLSSIMSLSIGHRNIGEEKNLKIYHRSAAIDQDAVIDIETRAARRPFHMATILPGLWISQTQNLVIGYHHRGRFANIQILDVQKAVTDWAERNVVDLQQLDAVIRQIIDVVSNRKSK